MERDGLGGFELVVLVVGGAVTALAVAVWGGAALALAMSGSTGGLPVEDAVAAAGQLPGQIGDPAGAWPAPVRDRLPGPIVYWACTAVAGAVVGTVVVAVVRFVAGPTVGTARRRPLGVDGRARFARRRDLATVLVRGPSIGRFVVARFGRWLVATGSAAHSADRRWGRRLVRRGDRGAVALVGPQRSGKTVAAIAGVLEWDGPAVLSSVKADLVGPTAGWRSSLGEVVTYDPTGSLGRSSLGRGELVARASGEHRHRCPAGGARSLRRRTAWVGRGRARLLAGASRDPPFWAAVCGAPLGPPHGDGVRVGPHAGPARRPR